MSDLAATVDKLCNASVKDYSNPYNAVAWEGEIDKAQWFTSPELISLHGTPIWNKLSEEQQKLLSFYEAINFFSLNIHGEKPLVEGMAHRIYSKDSRDVSPYLHHFIGEENNHMTWFGGFCMRYAGKIYPDKKLVFPREYAPGEEDFLFFAKVMIFEEIADAYNIQMSLDDRLHPIARRINHLHHHDEARHLVFGRKYVAEMWDRSSQKWSPATVKACQQYLKDYLVATWKEYYNPQVYKDAGIDDPFDRQEEAYQSEFQRTHRTEISTGCVAYLISNGMIDEEPRF